MGAEALLGIVTDILEFSKFSDEGAASRLKFEFVPFSMDKLSSDLARIVGVKAERAGVEVVVRAATPARCSGPQGRVLLSCGFQTRWIHCGGGFVSTRLTHDADQRGEGPSERGAAGRRVSLATVRL